jgi:Zn-dependent protease
MFSLGPATLIARLIVLVVSFTIHEFSHAWSATQLGDETPRQYGRLTLNPLAHLDPMGSLLLLLVGFGWAKPVPINPYALLRRTPAGVMWVSLAGPFSNLLMAILAAVPFRMGLVSVAAGMTNTRAILPNPSLILVQFITINLLLCLFNLIPLAPLDGEKILDYFLPPSMAKVFENIRPYGPVILIVLVLVGPMFGLDIIGMIIMPPLRALFGLLVG